MVDHSIKGSSILHRLQPESTGDGLVSSRFTLTTHVPFVGSTAVVEFDSALTGFDTFNDLGLTDIGTSGNIGPLDGDYLIVVYVMLAGNSVFTEGQGRCQIVDGGSPTPKWAWMLAPTTTPEMGVSDMRRYTAGSNATFDVEVALENWDGPSSVEIVEASVTITKLN